MTVKNIAIISAAGVAAIALIGTGTAVVLISTDFEEVASQSHRVLVMSHGRVAAEFSDVSELTADMLAEASYAAF